MIGPLRCRSTDDITPAAGACKSGWRWPRPRGVRPDPAAYGEARASREQVEIAREGLATAMDGFRNDLERARGAVPDRVGRTPRPIEVVNSLKLLIEARRRLIRTITDYDQAQFRLFVSMGSPRRWSTRPTRRRPASRSPVCRPR